MARKKTDPEERVNSEKPEQSDGEILANTPDSTGFTGEGIPEPAAASFFPASGEKKEEKIPEDVMRILERLPTLKEVYVDKWGGAYVRDTLPVPVGAILYLNPFYHAKN